MLLLEPVTSLYTETTNDDFFFFFFLAKKVMQVLIELKF